MTTGRRHLPRARHGIAWYWAVFWLAGLVLLAGGGIRFPGNPFNHFIERLELMSYDTRVQWQGGVPFADDRLAVVAISDRTFEILEREASTRPDAKWPFPNVWHARVAERLRAAGAKAVVFDLLSFLNPSREKYLDEDAAFASAAARFGGIGIANKFSQTFFAGNSETGAGAFSAGFRSWKLPAGTFARLPQGFVNFVLDPDERVRRYPPYMFRERLVTIEEASGPRRVLKAVPDPCLAIAALKMAETSAELLPPAPVAEKDLAVRYFAQVDPWRIASAGLDYAQVLLASSAYIDVSDQRLAARVKDRIVFVGPTAVEFHDVFFTPFSGRSQKDLPVPGVYLHAMIANALLTGVPIVRYQQGTEHALAILFLLVSLGLSWRLKPGKGLIAVGFQCAGYALFAFAAFRHFLLWLPLASPLMTAVGALIPNLTFRLMVTEQKHAMIRNLFSAYVSSKVLTFVQDNPDRLKLEGERREATVFFSDLKGFTTISETMSAERLSVIMNDYLTPMTEIIMEHEGYLDKYIGDAIMAVFGVPMEDRDHALHACQAAIRQKRRLVEVADRIKSSTNVQISARMGINTGIVSAGNMGSRDRFQYTVMGDIVNQASRFEGANKIFGSSIMMSETTYALVKDRVYARLLAHLTVKGKTKAVVVYELLDLREGQPGAADLDALCRDFDAAMAAFLAGRPAEAKAGFQAILGRTPDDGPAAFYIDQCDDLLKNGLPPGFVGEIVLETK
jgi:adenylate cyclase